MGSPRRVIVQPVLNSYCNIILRDFPQGFHLFPIGTSIADTLLNVYNGMIMRLILEFERDLKLVIEPWGHIEPVKSGQKVSFEYQRMYDSAGKELWPLVSFQEDGSVLVDLPSTALRAYINNTLFYECWD